MPEFVLSNLLLAEYRIPSITGYNRLEASPRTADFNRSLKAEIRDPLWMLTRQWQFGEFQGEDAASPVTAQILAGHTIMDRVSFPTGKSFLHDENIPLEVKVERERIGPDLFTAVQMGRYFIKLLKSQVLYSLKPKFLEKYELNYLIDENDTEGQQLYYSTKGKVFDGYKLYLDAITKEGGSTTSKFEDWVNSEASIVNPDKDKLKTLGISFREWFTRTYNQPEDATDSAWIPSQLEYQFAVASPQQAEYPQKTLVADQYYEGHLDWFSFDLNNRKQISLTAEIPAPPSVKEHLSSFIPSPVSFKGMPNPRYWALEENQTDFGKIDTSTTGLLHLLFAEFGLIYSNDWFMLPYPLQINTLCEIKGIVVTDVFGLHTLVRPAGRGPESNWQRWAIFQHTNKNNSSADTNLFYLAPSLTKSLEGEPLEKVNYLRDEMANMVWAVENTVPSQAGKGVSGNEMALKDQPEIAFTPAGVAKIKYVLGTTVPDNWIPFIPVHMEGSDTEIRLQRARMPGAKGALGVLLTEKPAPYFINEEEVPRAGIAVQRAFQRTRWLNGKTFLWIGRYKQAGRGEGHSNLKFDQIEDI